MIASVTSAVTTLLLWHDSFAVTKAECLDIIIAVTVLFTEFLSLQEIRFPSYVIHLLHILASPPATHSQSLRTLLSGTSNRATKNPSNYRTVPNYNSKPFITALGKYDGQWATQVQHDDGSIHKIRVPDNSTRILGLGAVGTTRQASVCRPLYAGLRVALAICSVTILAVAQRQKKNEYSPEQAKKRNTSRTFRDYDQYAVWEARTPQTCHQ